MTLKLNCQRPTDQSGCGSEPTPDILWESAPSPQIQQCCTNSSQNKGGKPTAKSFFLVSFLLRRCPLFPFLLPLFHQKGTFTAYSLLAPPSCLFLPRSSLTLRNVFPVNTDWKCDTPSSAASDTPSLFLCWPQLSLWSSSPSYFSTPEKG